MQDQCLSSQVISQYLVRIINVKTLVSQIFQSVGSVTRVRVSIRCRWTPETGTGKLDGVTDGHTVTLYPVSCWKICCPATRVTDVPGLGTDFSLLFGSGPVL